jgi:hypothetical protein
MTRKDRFAFLHGTGVWIECQDSLLLGFELAPRRMRWLWSDTAILYDSVGLDTVAIFN